MFKKKSPDGGEPPLSQGVQDAQYAAVPGGKGGVLRAACGFLAFALGISFLLEGVLFLGNSLTTNGGRRWLEDSFQDDYQNSQQFQSYVENYLETLLAIGSGGPVYSYGSYEFTVDSVTSSEPWSEEVQDYERQAQQWHQIHQKDQNVLYRVTRDDAVLYENTDAELSPWFTNTIPEGYNFLLKFDGETVRIWKNGKEADIYGDGYYEGLDGQWFVPGYRNFQAGDSVKNVTIAMAVIAQPRQFVFGNYGSSGGTIDYNQLYSLKQGLDSFRLDVQNHLVLLGAGALLLVLSILLRRDKARADRFLARWTGKAWFEVKLILLIALLLLLLPWPEYMNNLLTEVSYAYGGDAVTAMVSDNASWLLREYLSILFQYSGQLLLLFWAFYLLLFNDWRYNKRPWRQGIFALLCAHELKYPLQKRLSRRNGAFGLVLVLLEAELIALLVLLTVDGGLLPVWAIWNLLLLPLLLAAAVYAWFSWRQRRLWTDFGAVSDQISAIRAGDLARELQLPEDADLRGMADDLTHIQQGLHQAVEERTRSERMKVELVTNVSHDLKTPLTSIISYTELLSQEPLEPPASEYVRILSEKSQRLKAMVQDVFEVSKAASGQLPVKLEQLDFGRLLRQTLADMDGAIAHSGLTFRTAIPEEPVTITADSDRLYRVFQNLIGNALKYSLPGSRVYLSLAVEGDRARASVKNTSAAELRPDADYTARFVRGDESRSDGGSGLGLSIADSFTRACGGQLTISTEADLFIAAVSFPVEEARP